MLAFIRRTPNLCSFATHITVWNNDSDTSGFTLDRLTHLHLKIEGCSSFEQLWQLLSICSNVTNIVLLFWITGHNETMVDATGWQILIEQCVPRLEYLKIQLLRYVRIPSALDFADIFVLTQYWLERQPHFDIQVCQSSRIQINIRHTCAKQLSDRSYYYKECVCVISLSK
jgi:hypothetical protein